MALDVTNNIYSINAQRNMTKNQSGLQRSMERLSSGARINRASDDAAGLAISEKLMANIAAMTQASANASDAVSMIQVTEGAMDESSNMLIRMKELAEQAATGTVSTAERGYLDTEYKALYAEITRTAESTKFNDTYLLNGTLNVQIQVGTSNSANDVLTVSVGAVDAATLGLTTGISTVTGAQAALSTISDAIDQVSGTRAGLGALENRIESVISNLNTAVENLTSANSQIRDTDVAAETANMTKYNVLVQAGVAVLAQANSVPSLALTLLK